MFLPKLLTIILNLKPNYLVLKSFPKGKYFAIILRLYILLKNSDFFITYKEGFNLHTVKRNLLQLPEDEHYPKCELESPHNYFLVSYSTLKIIPCSCFKLIQQFCYY